MSPPCVFITQNSPVSDSGSWIVLNILYYPYILVTLYSGVFMHVLFFWRPAGFIWNLKFWCWKEHSAAHKFENGKYMTLLARSDRWAQQSERAASASQWRRAPSFLSDKFAPQRFAYPVLADSTSPGKALRGLSWNVAVLPTILLDPALQGWGRPRVGHSRWVNL